MPELLMIMAVLLLLFGATRLPQLGSSLGSAIRNFKKGFAGEEEEKAPGAPPASTASLKDTSHAEANTSPKVPSKEG